MTTSAATLRRRRSVLRAREKVRSFVVETGLTVEELADLSGYDDLFDLLSKRPNRRALRAEKQRIEGHSLECIARDLDVTRERARQILLGTWAACSGRWPARGTCQCADG